MSEELLRGIDQKLRALLALQVHQQLADKSGSSKKPRSLDVVLADAGLSAKEIATILGKTDRAVRLVLQGAKTAKSSVEESGNGT